MCRRERGAKSVDCEDGAIALERGNAREGFDEVRRRQSPRDV
jgi:hypothetical protein